MLIYCNFFTSLIKIILNFFLKKKFIKKNLHIDSQVLIVRHFYPFSLQKLIIVLR